MRSQKYIFHFPFIAARTCIASFASMKFAAIAALVTLSASGATCRVAQRNCACNTSRFVRQG